jgi:hypothetical protein
MCDNPLCDIEHDDDTPKGAPPSMGDGARQSGGEAPAMLRQTARQIAACFGAASVFTVITAAATALRLRHLLPPHIRPPG